MNGRRADEKSLGNEMTLNQDAQKKLFDLLLAYEPQSSDQIQLKEQFINFIHEHPQCLARDNFYGHITASAWVVDIACEKALLTLHRKIGLWLQCGGHAEGDPDLMRVAMRELSEESGLVDLKPIIPGIFDLDLHRIPAVGQDPSHLHFDVRFFLQLQQAQPLVISEESIDLAWYSAEEIQDLNTDASVLRLCQKWQEQMMAVSIR